MAKEQQKGEEEQQAALSTRVERESKTVKMVLLQILAPLYLPVLQLVTLASTPLTAGYAVLGLATSPIVVPLLIVLRLIKFTLFSPLLILALPVAVPVGGLLAFLCTAHEVICSLFTVLTPLLWPLCFFLKFWHYTCCIAQVLVTDTIMPWLVPIRYSLIAWIVPKLLLQ